jgi:hypothetical protein
MQRHRLVTRVNIASSLSLAGLITTVATGALPLGCSSGDAAPNSVSPNSDSGTPANGDSGSGTGSDGGGGPDGTTAPPSVCDGAGTRALTTDDAFVDDFEGAAISPGWSSFNDVQPTPNSVKILQVAGGAAQTGHAGQYAGKGAKTATAGGYGVGTVYNVAIDPGAGILCIDISAFDGVSFWAKAASAGSKVSVNFVVPQTNEATTDSTGHPNGGDCKAHCFNHPRVVVALTSDWAQYTVKFADAAGGSAKVGSVIQEIAWLSPDADWDFSIDEIAFYKGTPPAGAIGHGGGDGGAAHDAAKSD